MRESWEELPSLLVLLGQASWLYPKLVEKSVKGEKMSKIREAQQRMNESMEQMIELADDFPLIKEDVEAYILLIGNFTGFYTKMFAEKAKSELFPHLGGHDESSLNSLRKVASFQA